LHLPEEERLAAQKEMARQNAGKAKRFHKTTPSHAPGA
jgi:hypothetical protein